MNIGAAEARIFEAHAMIFEAPEFLENAINRIKQEELNAEYALNIVTCELLSLFEVMDNDYIKVKVLGFLTDLGQTLSIPPLWLELWKFPLLSA